MGYCRPARSCPSNRAPWIADVVDGPLTRLRPEEMVAVERSLTAVLGFHSGLG
jgi:hypothetical protein